MKRLFIIIITLMIIVSCSNQVSDTDSAEDITSLLNPTESFQESDAPTEYEYDSVSFTGPWGYDKTANSLRKYPLLVSGAWGEGETQYSSYQKIYPAFVLDYEKNTESAGQLLADWITDAVAAGYRIDTDRIYLTGFSMEGSGSYS